MTLSISLSRETEAKLLERAAAAGKEPTAYALQLLERAVNGPDAPVGGLKLTSRLPVLPGETWKMYAPPGPFEAGSANAELPVISAVKIKSSSPLFVKETDCGGMFVLPTKASGNANVEPVAGDAVPIGTKFTRRIRLLPESAINRSSV